MERKLYEYLPTCRGDEIWLDETAAETIGLRGKVIVNLPTGVPNGWSITIINLYPGDRMHDITIKNPSNSQFEPIVLSNVNECVTLMHVGSSHWVVQSTNVKPVFDDALSDRVAKLERKFNDDKKCNCSGILAVYHDEHGGVSGVAVRTSTGAEKVLR